MRGKEERKGAALSFRAFDTDLATEQSGNLAADRKAEAGATVLPVGRSIRLLECLEDQALLVLRDADTRVLNRKRDNICRRIQGVILEPTAFLGATNR